MLKNWRQRVPRAWYEFMTAALRGFLTGADKVERGLESILGRLGKKGIQMWFRNVLKTMLTH